MKHIETTDRVIQFLLGVGLDVVELPGAAGFCKGVRIAGGALYVDRSNLSPSNLLHEAGHVAVTPGNFRSDLSDDVEDASERMLEKLTKLGISGCEWPENPLFRATLQCGEAEATAWSYAAGVYLGLAPNQIIARSDFNGDGAAMLTALKMRAHFGINGLHHAGMCTRKDYPLMRRWVQETYPITVGENGAT